MHLTRFGGLAALAGFSQAFLVPPSISADDIKTVNALPFEIAAAGEGQSLDIDCPGCPIDTKSTGVAWAQAKSIIRLNVSIEHSDQQPDRLLLNGIQILPVDTRAAFQGMFADQFVKAPDGSLGLVGSPELGYSISIKPYHDGRQDLSVYAVHVRIIEVANRFVRNVPTIELKVIRTPSEKLIIADSNITSGPVATESLAECTTMLCKWKAILAGKVEGLRKGCGRKKGGAHRIPRPYGIKGGHPKPEGFGRSHPHNRPHGQYHHGRPHGNMILRVLRAFTFHIVLPVLFGMAIGVTASVIGVLFGHFVIFVWRMLFRRGEHGQCHHRRDEDADEDCEDESKGFLENQDAPPVYEEVVIVEQKPEQN